MKLSLGFEESLADMRLKFKGLLRRETPPGFSASKKKRKSRASELSWPCLIKNRAN